MLVVSLFRLVRFGTPALAILCEIGRMPLRLVLVLVTHASRRAPRAP
jgi:hypothetical protein